MTTREVRDILPENNTGVVLVPQILTNKTEDFLEIAARLASYGYDTVNLNLGCPSGTVTAKKRGAGFLGEPDALDAFLYEIYEKCPLHISIKTRLGISDLCEWEALLAIYAKYPVQELIVHTRLLQEFYTGVPHPEAYAQALRRLHDSNSKHPLSAEIPLCYNGDILSAESLSKAQAKVLSCFDSPDRCDQSGKYDSVIGRVMIGRGLLRNPALARQLREKQPHTQTTAGQAQGSHAAKTLRAFHDEILDGYREIMSGDLPVLFKMKDLWTYMIMAFVSFDPAQSPEILARQNIEKHLKKIRKADRIAEYQIAVDTLFRECCDT